MNAYNYTIKDIESMSEANLADMADEVETIKGHTVYFVDFGGYFGFSACVCADGQHIYYANDYELHHEGKSRDELREIYRRKLTGTLFTESELSTVSSYEDKSAEKNAESFDYWKSAFLHEMYNHEYGINWQADFDVCSCFANCNGVKDYTSASELFAACGFTDTQKAAYMAARREYFKTHVETEE